LREERKMAARPGLRTSAPTLRKLAQASMIFELESARSRPGDWDRFQVRKIGLAVQGRMAERFAGDAEKFRAAAVKGLGRELGITTNDWRGMKLSVLSDFSVALFLVEDLSRWNEDEKKALVKIIRAKATSDESSYLKLMQKHPRLRSAMIQLGSQ